MTVKYTVYRTTLVKIDWYFMTIGGTLSAKHRIYNAIHFLQ